MQMKFKPFTGEWGKPLAMGVILLIVLTAVGWMSLRHFLQLQDTQGQFRATLELEHQVAQLRQQYLQSDPLTLAEELQVVDQVLVPNFTQLTRWAQTLQDTSASLNLQTQYRILKTKPTTGPVENVRLIPMEIHLQSQTTQSGYQEFVQFLRELDQTGHRVDIHELTMTGDGQKATHLKIGLNVWMKATDSVEL